MEKVHIIVNPISARGQTGKRWLHIKEAIKSYYREFKYIFTEKPRQATEIARDILKAGYNLIIGVGGDGTINEIINGFFHQTTSDMINGQASLGMIPSGTGSDFTRFLKLPRDFNQSLSNIKKSRIKKIDIGRITYLQKTTDRITYFVNVADFGLGAEVVKKLSVIPASKRGGMVYYRGLLSTIKTYQSEPTRIILDDDTEFEDNYLIGAIANGKIFGGGMKIAPEAQPDDGYFDVVLIRDMKRLEIIRNSVRLYTGTILDHPKVIWKRAQKVTVFSDAPINIEYDGEIGNPLPVEFTCIEKRINFRI